MDLLFMGGSRFVGRHAVLEALGRGHRVTLFNRGSHPPPHQDVRQIQGDRDRDLDRLEGERFDAVIDTSGYLPRQVREAVGTLASRVDSYLFVSSISVYANQGVAHQKEDAPLIELPDPTVEEITGETYGGLKVLCERELQSAFPGKSVVVRPGVIVGPYDPTDRFTYWPVRTSRGGEMLAPGGPEQPVQFIDVRDLAQWMVAMLELGEEGVYNAVSQPDRFTMGGLIDHSRAASGAEPDVTWVDEEFLLQRGVKPFSDLPLWLAGESANFMRVDADSAYSKGLSIRPLEDTVAATLDWYRGEGEPKLKVGLSPERERELLEEWRSA